MKMSLILSFLLAIFSACSNPASQTKNTDTSIITSEKPAADIVTGAQQIAKYLPLLKGKNVGLSINNTSVIDGKLSMDTLLKLGVKVVKGFGPEHGFRGKASAGAKIGDETD